MQTFIIGPLAGFPIPRVPSFDGVERSFIVIGAAAVALAIAVRLFI